MFPVGILFNEPPSLITLPEHWNAREIDSSKLQTLGNWSQLHWSSRVHAIPFPDSYRRQTFAYSTQCRMMAIWTFHNDLIPPLTIRQWNPYSMELERNKVCFSWISTADGSVHTLMDDMHIVHPRKARKVTYWKHRWYLYALVCRSRFRELWGLFLIIFISHSGRWKDHQTRPWSNESHGSDMCQVTPGECCHEEGDDSAIGIAEKHDAFQLLAVFWPYLRFASGDQRFPERCNVEMLFTNEEQ